MHPTQTNPNAPVAPLSHTPSRLQLGAAFAVIYLVWGSTYLGIRFAVETMPPFLMTSTRFLIAGSILYAFTRTRTQHKPSASEWRSAFVIGTLLLLGGNGLVTWAEQWIDSAIAALIVATTPVWFVVADWLLYRGQRPGRWMIISTALGLIGVYLLTDRAQDPEHTINSLAVPAMLLAPILWAIGSVMSKRRPQPTPLLLAVAMQMLCGGLMQLLTATVLGEWGQLDLAAISLRSHLAFWYLTIVGSLVAFSTYVYLVRHASPASASTYAYVNPLIAVVLGATLGGETIGPRIVAATALILLAVLALTRHGRTAHAAGGALTADINLNPSPEHSSYPIENRDGEAGGDAVAESGGESGHESGSGPAANTHNAH